MELLQDPAFKLKYQRSKYKVKIWESDFLKTNGCNPSKNDIKIAPIKVREAYKMYYKLKSMVLQDTLMDITFSDGPENLPAEAKLPEAKVDIEFAVPTEDVKTPRMVLGDIKVDETVGKNKTAVDEDSLKTKLPDELNGVWGDHLNKTAVPKAISTSEKKRQLSKSQSFNLSKKLFAGSTFNKRNPRKSFSFSRPQKEKVNDDSVVDSLSVCSQPAKSSTDMSVSLPLFQDQSQSSEILHSQTTKMLPNFLNTSENFKVVLNSTPKISSQPVSAIQRVLNTSHNDLKLTPRNIDRGWLDRCTKYNSLDRSNGSLNSTTHSQLFTGIEQRSSFGSSRRPDGEESDEDLVYSSDDDQGTSTPFPCLESAKRKQLSEESQIIENDDTESGLRPREKSPIMHLENPPKRVKYVDKVTTELDSSSVTKTDSNVDGDKIKNIDIEKIADDIVKKEKKLRKKPVKGPTKITKQDVLEKKMSSGQANENFVKINLKKKVFVRGKKNMNFSKYKKTEWKKKKKAAGSVYDGPAKEMSTCFKCGDIGHWAGDCKNKGDSLLPVDENEVEESQFPTLEEVQAMCLRSEHSRNDKSVTHFESQDCLIVDETNPAQNEGENFSNELIIVNNIKPLYELNPDGTVIDTPREVFKALKKLGHESFRPGQEEAIMRVLSGLSTLVTLSTGSGKSLCYQLPAYLMSQRSPCITLVISPLVSLMEDQVLGTCKSLKAACLHTNQKPEQRLRVMEQAKAGEIDILLVSPEAVVSGEKSTGFGSILRELPAIAFACIDEAHCVSQWSHNFRPSYLMICRVLREKLGVKTVLGLTATATQSTCNSIVRHLEIPDGDRGVVRDIPLPNNLVLSVSKDPSPDRALITLLRGERFCNSDSIIVYCTRQAECERLAVLIRTSFQDIKPPEGIKIRKTMSWFSEAYHAGLSASRRKQIQTAFMTGHLRIVVATVAFGMGINKQDIRAVIHFNMPKTFESYVQEIGRAGRDGLPAHCHLFLDSQGGDQNELRRHIFSDSMDRHTIRKLLERVFVPCKCVQISDMIDGIAFNDDFHDETPVENKKGKANDDNACKISNIKCPGHEVAFVIDDTVQALDIPQENIATLLCYLELHKKKWIKVLSPVYTMCKVMSYKGSKGLKAAAQLSPPLAMAIALDRRRGVSHEKSTVLEFPVVEIASAIGWESGTAKRHLKNLMWKKSEDGRWLRTGLSVEFSVLGFHVRAPGNLSATQLDEALDSLYERVNRQEETALLQLQVVFKALTSVSHPNCIECRDSADEVRSEKLKTMIREYFNQNEITDQIDVMTKLPNEEEVAGDVRSLICSFRDQTFTGRAVARIFYGINSPCYPATTWGRNRYWRSHLKSDFKLLCAIATREILRIR